LPKFVVDQSENLAWIDGGGIQQHDWDIVLNGVNTATDAAFQAAAAGVENDRLFAIGTDQYVEQILRNHRDSIVILWDRIGFRITGRH
jgi:hypothetical protein